MTIMNEALGKINTEELNKDFKSTDFTNEEFDVYYRLAQALHPRSILEVGIYKGYSACAMILGAQETLLQYIGLDAQLYIPGTNAMAIDHISRFTLQNVPDISLRANVKILACNTQVEIPLEVSTSYYDWVHIDAGHDKQEAISDIVNFWGCTKGVLSVHDYTSHHEVKKAVDEVVAKGLIGFTSVFFVKSSHGFFFFLR